ncbi:peptide/nickel transport system permease protein/oligopeptide transport system permease protein [Roseimicrobium gellanilyticum]|uniref:Oligopeptide transport system permease protein OppC n=1 Tax=Roseimicrobium gellanilyticum TaxID=748857 RepID=A0A366HSP1_9BACT|nr:ABC transporter permease [Roseimicrobium gellanilyticum]RBP47296.1 peptide/nickel transport system permease protein/oligopeptide transport system permease protein [Roseimicrobium gellanilyticum]
MADGTSTANRWTGAPPNGWDVLKRNRVAMVSLWFLVFVALSAIVIPFFLPDALKTTSDASFSPPMSESADKQHVHYLGTDVNGQDLFYRLLMGAQVSMGVGLVAALVSLLIGGVYGMVSGYAGGRVDGGMMRLVDILNSVPSLLFVMIFISAFDGHFKDALDGMRLYGQEKHWQWLEKFGANLIPYSRIMILVIALSFIQWLTMARIVRGQVLVLKELAFVTAARTMGQSGWAILWKHLWPNLSTIVLTYLTLTIPAVIRDESFLSFLGLGIDDPAASWGSLLKDGAQVINPLDSKWWLLAFPAGLMSACLLALNFLGDGLRDAFDPKSND